MYSVKKFCDMIGVPLSTLRYYERIGLLNPKKNEKNKYREYTVHDAFKVNNFRAIRGMGFEAKEALDMMECPDAGAYYERIAERENKLIDEIFLMQEQLTAVQNYKQVLELAQSEKQHTIGHRKDMYFLRASNGTEFTESTFEQFSQWVQLVPVTRYAKFIEKESFLSNRLGEHMHYGIAMECQYEFLLEQSAKENVDFLKGGECLYLHTKNFNYGTNFSEGQKEVQVLLDQYGYEIDGPILLEGTRVTDEEGQKGQFISIPVRKAETVL